MNREVTEGDTERFACCSWRTHQTPCTLTGTANWSRRKKRATQSVSTPPDAQGHRASRWLQPVASVLPGLGLSLPAAASATCRSRLALKTREGLRLTRHFEAPSIPYRSAPRMTARSSGRSWQHRPGSAVVHLRVGIWHCHLYSCISLQLYSRISLHFLLAKITLQDFVDFSSYKKCT